MKIVLFAFLVMLVGGLVSSVYWPIASGLQMLFCAPFVGWMKKALDSPDEGSGFPKGKLYFMAFYGAIFTIFFCLIWTILAGFVTLTAIINTHSVGWTKWIFLVEGFGLAIYSPGLLDDREWGLQQAVAAITLLVGYLLNALFIIYWAIPHYLLH